MDHKYISLHSKYHVSAHTSAILRTHSDSTRHTRRLYSTHTSAVLDTHVGSTRHTRRQYSTHMSAVLGTHVCASNASQQNLTSQFFLKLILVNVPKPYTNGNIRNMFKLQFVNTKLIKMRMALMKFFTLLND